MEAVTGRDGPAVMPRPPVRGRLNGRLIPFLSRGGAGGWLWRRRPAWDAVPAGRRRCLEGRSDWHGSCAGFCCSPAPRRRGPRGCHQGRDMPGTGGGPHGQCVASRLRAEAQLLDPLGRLRLGERESAEVCASVRA